MADKKQIYNALKRYIHGLYTKEDVKALSNQSDLKSSLPYIEKEMDQIWDELSSMETVPNKLKEYQEEARILLKIKENPSQKINLTRLVKYAAVVALILISGWGIFISINNPKEIIYTEIKVNNAEHKEIVLPDSTKVILNAGSYIRYPNDFDGKTRDIQIDGEAFFDVYKDQNKPFIVHTQKVDIKVLGTAFNVKSYNNDEQVTVSVQSGKVQVDMEEAMTRLIANEQLVLDKQTGEFQRKNEDVKLATSWINGGLYFNKTPIHSVVQELERMYNCRITFQEGAIYDVIIYGEHDNKSLESVLKSIQYTTDIKYKKKGNQIVLYK